MAKVAKTLLAEYAQIDLRNVPRSSPQELLILERLVREAFDRGLESRPRKETNDENR